MTILKRKEEKSRGREQIEKWRAKESIEELCEERRHTSLIVVTEHQPAL